MKTLPAPLTTAITAETSYLCRIWELTLANATVLRYTDLTQDIVVGGNTYVADPGITVSALLATVGGGQNASISVNFANGLIDEGMIRRGSLDSATFTLRAVHWPDPSLGTIPLFTGSVADIEWHDKLQAVITVRASLAGRSETTAGEVYSRTCRANLGDDRCKVNLPAISTNFTVASVSSDGQTVTGTALVGGAAGYYAFGVIEWLTGNNVGLIDEVKVYDPGPGALTLALAPRFPILVSDTGVARPGCNKEATTCLGKFNNLANLRAEPYAPPPGVTPMSNWQPPPALMLYKG